MFLQDGQLLTVCAVPPRGLHRTMAMAVVFGILVRERYRSGHPKKTQRQNYFPHDFSFILRFMRMLIARDFIARLVLISTVTSQSMAYRFIRKFWNSEYETFTVCRCDCLSARIGYGR